MSPDERPQECVAFLLVRGGRVLAEQRGPTNRVVPRVLAIPGGHMEPGETAEEAVRRELEEETGITHCAFVFHDSMLECIADALAVSVSREPYDRILAHLTELSDGKTPRDSLSRSVMLRAWAN